MTRTLFTMLIASAALAGCNSEPTIIGGPADDGANAAANANVQLPPSIAASRIYRCADNDVVYVDWTDASVTIAVPGQAAERCKA